MITWDELVYDLNELCKLENGGGAEIEFEYAGAEYIIVCYKDWCSLAAAKEYGEKKAYHSLGELGDSRDFGFQLSEVWDQISLLECRPDFESFHLQEIMDAYQAALIKRKKNGV